MQKIESNDWRSNPLAVIDIGSSAIRMTIAQVDDNGTIHLLESLQQAISLGKDTFTSGIIKKSSIEECVRALKSFKRILEEYRITPENQVRVVATTAVREAANKDAFTDRIYIGTGFNVEIIDEIDLARLTYLSVRAYLADHKFQWGDEILVTEMSGGSTELLYLRSGNVILSKNYRLGALRLREMIDEFRAPFSRQRQLMESDVVRTIGQITNDLLHCKHQTMIALGGDARFAASQLNPEWNFSGPLKISLGELSKFTDKIVGMSVDEIVQKFHLSFSDAESVGPALLFYVRLAKALDIKSVVIADISMRSGILRDMVTHGAWSDQFIDLIINSAIETGRKYQFDEAHARHIEQLSTILFRALKDEHGLPPWYELHLRIAAILHDIGTFVNIRSHHKHSMYLIQNSDLFGMNKKDVLLISLIARYHRRSAPKPVHEEYNMLDRESRLAVIKIAAILRVADALDRSGSQRIQKIYCSSQEEGFVITVPNIDDLMLEQLGIKTKGNMFEDIYGMNIILRKKL